MGVVTFHAGEQEGSPIEVKVFGVELDPVRRGFQAEAGTDLIPVLFVQGEERPQGIGNVPAPVVERTYPELVRNVFLPFRGYFKRSIDFNMIQRREEARKDIREEGSP